MRPELVMNDPEICFGILGLTSMRMSKYYVAVKKKENSVLLIRKNTENKTLPLYYIYSNLVYILKLKLKAEKASNMMKGLE